MRRFWLYRDEDETGVSGTGPVAEGVAFTEGKVVLTWRTDHTSVAVYDDVKAVEAIHGHEGRTRVVWLDPLRGPRRVHGRDFDAVPRDSMGEEIRKGALVLPLKLLEREREPYLVTDVRCQADGHWVVSSIGWPEHGYGSAAEYADQLRVVAPPAEEG